MPGKTHDSGLILGVDVGSVSVSVVSLDLAGTLKEYSYRLHHGHIRGKLDEMLMQYKDQKILGVASPSGQSHFTSQVRVFDQQVSLMEAASRLQLKARSILHVGAERFYLLALDEKGKYLQTSHSSSCAAGTGSFLDQQAVRLNLNDTGHLSDMALKNSSPIPDIAARCSVFAKTDLIHAQQKGTDWKPSATACAKASPTTLRIPCSTNLFPNRPSICREESPGTSPWSGTCSASSARRS
jgi:activator of 2-hydroxyglutaryl-CoA dehydratase